MNRENTEIKPVNGHLLIEPVKHEAFIASDRGTYEEIGVVLGIADDVLAHLSYRKSPFEGNGTGPSCSLNEAETIVQKINKGDRVYFDSWMAAKYPKNDEEFYWLVPWSEVRAVEHV